MNIKRSGFYPAAHVLSVVCRSAAPYCRRSWAGHRGVRVRMGVVVRSPFPFEQIGQRLSGYSAAMPQTRNVRACRAGLDSASHWRRSGEIEERVLKPDRMGDGVESPRTPMKSRHRCGRLLAARRGGQTFAFRQTGGRKKPCARSRRAGQGACVYCRQLRQQLWQ